MIDQATHAKAHNKLNERSHAEERSKEAQRKGDAKDHFNQKR